MKARLGKKFYAVLPAKVAEIVRQMADAHGIKSATFVSAPFGRKFYAGEGDKIAVVYGDRAESVEMVSESTIGASGVNTCISAEIPTQPGAFVIMVHYYTRYFMTIYNIGEIAIKQGDRNTCSKSKLHN